MKRKQDAEGDFILNGVKIHFKLKYWDVCDNAHFDFDSKEIPNAISETGYKSVFVDHENFKRDGSVQNVIRNLIEYEVSHDSNGKPLKNKPLIRLEFL